MAELIIGTVSLITLVNTFETALHLYIGLVHSTRTANSKARLLAIKVLIEQEKFRLFGHYTGILRSKNGLLLQKLPAQSQNLIPIIVEEVQSLLSDADTLLSKYGISSESDKSPPQLLQSACNPRGTNTTISSSISAINLNGPSQKAVLPTELKLKYAKKVIWVWTDEKKVTELHQHLRDLNEALWGTLSTHHLAIMNKALPSFVLPGLTDIQSLAEIKENVRDTANSKIIGDCAEMRQDIMAPPEEMQSSEAWKRIKIPKAEIHITKTHVSKGIDRCEGLYRSKFGSEQVVIEYKTLQHGLTDDQKLVARTRIRQIAFQLLEPRSPDLCLFQCLGLVEDTTETARYGLILKMGNVSANGIVSLESLLMDPKLLNRIDLSERFALAQSLCYAVLHWHASGWLHKSINTANIVFLRNKTGLPNLESPRLLGFESSRPDQMSEMSLMSMPMTDGQIGWFRHPDYQNPMRDRFHRSYDYYSLGVVLFAIGYWDTIDNVTKRFIQRQPKDSKDPQMWRAFLISRADASLGSQCGSIYRNAVLRCLRGDFGLDENGKDLNRDSHFGDWQRAYLFTVVNELAKCIV